MSITLLSGHVSPETAYVVTDYPYGFKLRCQIRYWLDVHPKHGVRLMSQTSNPKRAGLVWNTAKASTYALFAAAMYLDEQDHVKWSAMGQYKTGAEALAWLETYGDGVPEACRKVMDAWVRAKVAFDAHKGQGEVAAVAAARQAAIAA